MRSAAILALVSAACSSTQSSPPPGPGPGPATGDDVSPVTTPPAPEAGRTPSIPADHELFGRVEGRQAAGECADDSACVVGGCSAEVCSAEQVQTTCEAREWPTKGSTCGCVSGQCVWYRGSEPEPAGDDFKRLLSEFEKMADQMCACANSNCAEAVNKGFEDWLRANDKAEGSDEVQAAAMKIAERYAKCMMTAMAGAPQQGAKCGVDDRCADGLTCVKYYGVAGAAGPQFKSCEIPCGKGKPACPTGQTCRIIADGPGQVCRK